MNVLTIGTFDLLHPGHLELLEGCRGMVGPEGRVWVGVNQDEFVARFKGHRPVQPLEHRMEILRALRLVDAVFPNVGDEEAGRLIDQVNPDVLAIGDDWYDAGADDPQARYRAQLGFPPIPIVYLPRSRGLSSTAIRAAL